MSVNILRTLQERPCTVAFQWPRALRSSAPSTSGSTAARWVATMETM